MEDEFPQGLPNPDWGLDATHEFSIAEVQFNHGYTQRAELGINDALRSWNPTWSQLTESDAARLEKFLVERRGVYPFWWDTPDGERVWVVSGKKVSKKCDAYDSFTITVSLTEEP